MRRSLPAGLALGLAAPFVFATTPAIASWSEPFALEEATVASLHEALGSGKVSCRQVIEESLARIAAYDDQGPTLNAILTVNEGGALALADAFDEAYEPGETITQTLACAPLVLKDNYDTADLPTSGGAVTLANSVPPDDAFTVARLREAGAIVVAKANRTPGGSSGGTGASLAASFGILGTGSDTGQSIRSPASANSLVGVRPTRGLISRDGIIPVSSTQDEAGPITRTVADAAVMLDVMVGYDPADPVTAFGIGQTPDSYTEGLHPDALRGARIGLLEDVIGEDDTVHGPVNRVLDQAVGSMAGLGATVVPVRIPGFTELTTDIAVADFETKTVLNDYFASLGDDAPVSSLEEFIAAGEYDPAIEDALLAQQAVENGLADPEYQRRLLQRDEFRQAIAVLMAENDLDAILYPHQQRLVVPIGEEQVERNGVLSNATGYPAVTFPGGFSEPTDSAPLGVPVGIELLGRDYDEPRLMGYAYAYEQATQARQAPVSTPPLG